MKALARPLATVTLASVLTACGLGDSQRHLRNAVDAQRDDLQSCYAGALAREATAAGEVQAFLHVEDDEGRIEHVEIVRTDFGDDAFHACLEGSLRRLRLEEPPPANLKVEYVFEFRHR